jgi:hypothetical protein
MPLGDDVDGAVNHRDGGLVNVYPARSTDYGDQFPLNQRINTVDWRFAAGVATNGGSSFWIGDYQGIASTLGRTYLLWNDARDGQLELCLVAVAES